MKWVWNIIGIKKFSSKKGTVVVWSKIAYSKSKQMLKNEWENKNVIKIQKDNGKEKVNN